MMAISNTNWLGGLICTIASCIEFALVYQDCFLISLPCWIVHYSVMVPRSTVLYVVPPSFIAFRVNTFISIVKPRSIMSVEAMINDYITMMPVKPTKKEM